MEKRHIYFLEILSIVLILLFSLLYSSNKSNSEEIDAIYQEVERMSEDKYKDGSEQMEFSIDFIEESLLEAEINIEKINNQLLPISEVEVKKIGDSIEVFQTSIDEILTNIDSNSNKSIEDLESSITQLALTLDEISSKHEKNLSTTFKAIITEFQRDLDDVVKDMTSTQNSQELLTQDLEQIVLDLSEQLNLFSLYIQQATDGSAIAAESFSCAADATRTYEERRYYYLNAIMHNPTEAKYYNDYILFLDDNNAIPDEYWTLATILDSAMTQMEPSAIKILLPIYEEITSEILVADSETEEAFVDTYSVWQNSAEDFIEKVKSGHFESNEIQTYYDAAVLAYEALDEVALEDQKQYELVNHLYSLFSSYFNLSDLYKRVMGMDDDTFISSYPLASQIIESGKSAFLVNSYGDEYSVIIDNTYKEILHISEEINKRYDYVRALQLLESLKSLVTETNRVVSSSSSSSSLDSVIEKYREVQLEFSTYASTITSQDSTNYIMEMQEFLSAIQEDIYTAQFTEYQLWASSILSRASSVKSDYEKEDRLNVLYRLGYFEINPSLLIPQLSAVYNSIDWADMEEKSRYTVDQLIKRYNPIIKGIGEI